MRFTRPLFFIAIFKDKRTEKYILRCRPAEHEDFSTEHCRGKKKPIVNRSLNTYILYKADIEMAVKQDLYFTIKHRELVDIKMRKEIEYRDYRFWSEQDKRFADRMSDDSY